MSMCMCVFVCISERTCVCLCIHVCMCVYMCMCVCMCMCAPSPTLSPTDPVPRGLLTLWARAGMCVCIYAFFHFPTLHPICVSLTPYRRISRTACAHGSRTQNAWLKHPLKHQLKHQARHQARHQATQQARQVPSSDDTYYIHRLQKLS